MMRGIKEDDVHPLIYEYSARKQMSELGFVFDGSKLTSKQVEGFLYINSCISEFQDEQGKLKGK